MGLGFATLIPQDGNAAMETADVPGIKLSGMIFDAGPRRSYALLEVGVGHEHFRRGFDDGRWSHGASDPTLLQDVFFRIGGAETAPVHTENALVVNTDNTILDDVWSWRADHGNDVGWTSNTADTGVIVNGDNVDAYGLFVEHYQKFEVIWNGRDGEDVFFQNEMPYDPPSQSAWMSSPTHGRVRRLPGDAAGEGLPGLRDGELLVLQPGRPDLRRPGVPVADQRGPVPRHLHAVPQRQRRERRDQLGDQRGRPVRRSRRTPTRRST